MNRNNFIEHIEKIYAECIEIVKKKNQDYAGEDDPWKNFRFSEIIDVPVEKAILVRVMDKMARINNLLYKDNAVKDEAIEDTLNDVINYLAILKAYINSNRSVE